MEKLALRQKGSFLLRGFRWTALGPWMLDPSVQLPDVCNNDNRNQWLLRKEGTRQGTRNRGARPQGTK